MDYTCAVLVSGGIKIIDCPMNATSHKLEISKVLCDLVFSKMDNYEKDKTLLHFLYTIMYENVRTKMVVVCKKDKYDHYLDLDLKHFCGFPLKCHHKEVESDTQINSVVPLGEAYQIYRVSGRINMKIMQTNISEWDQLVEKKFKPVTMLFEYPDKITNKNFPRFAVQEQLQLEPSAPEYTVSDEDLPAVAYHTKQAPMFDHKPKKEKKSVFRSFRSKFH